MTEPVRTIKPNKNATLQSLTAFCYMITAKTKEEFCFWYSIAAHDNNGASIWYWMQKSKRLNRTKGE